MGQAWAEVGLGHARLALEGSARALQRTAKAIDVVASACDPPPTDARTATRVQGVF